ncbi:MAG: hypothetical protein E6R10_06635 [Rhodocyclaceae bacterium]|nr:MAG: hypothetical protein E6R10_06635 [Rhodocyclaceae bacterium]
MDAVAGTESESAEDSANSTSPAISPSFLERARKAFHSKWSGKMHVGFFVCAVLLALLPTSWIIWVFLFGVGIPVAWRLTSASFTAGIFLLIGAIFLATFGPIVFTLVVILVSGIYPTVLNLWAAWLVSRQLKLRVFQIAAFLPVALLLGLSYRLVPMAEDIVHGTSNEKTYVDRVINLRSGEALSVGFVDENISWRKDIADALGIGGNEGCMCAYWSYPAKSHENILTALRQAGLRYQINSDGPKRLEMKAYTEHGVTILALDAWDGNQKTASYEGRFREGYGPEIDLFSKSASLDSIPYRILYLASANIWNHFASKLLPQSPISPIKTFIAKAFDLKAEPSITRHVIAQMTASSSPQDHYDLSAFRSSFPIRTLKCDTQVKVVGPRLSFYSRGEEFSVIYDNGWPEYVECTDTAVYVVVLRQENTKDGIPMQLVALVQKYSMRGEILDSVEAEFRNYPPQGFSGKPLRGFSETENSYQFELNEFANASGRDGITHIRSSVWQIPKASQPLR